MLPSAHQQAPELNFLTFFSGSGLGRHNLVGSHVAAVPVAAASKAIAT